MERPHRRYGEKWNRHAAAARNPRRPASVNPPRFEAGTTRGFSVAPMLPAIPAGRAAGAPGVAAKE